MGEVLQRAERHFRNRDWAKSEMLYQNILNEQPGNPDAMHMLGLIAFQTNHVDAGLDLIRKSLAVKLDATYLNNLGHILASRGDYESAAEACQQAVSLRPDLAETHTNLGNALRGMGKLFE